eukprot:scaffold9369_cov62-Phaeocystis_antarctica.AAC.4
MASRAAARTSAEGSSSRSSSRAACTASASAGSLASAGHQHRRDRPATIARPRRLHRLRLVTGLSLLRLVPGLIPRLASRPTPRLLSAIEDLSIGREGMAEQRDGRVPRVRVGVPRQRHRVGFHPQPQRRQDSGEARRPLAATPARRLRARIGGRRGAAPLLGGNGGGNGGGGGGLPLRLPLELPLELPLRLLGGRPCIEASVEGFKRGLAHLVVLVGQRLEQQRRHSQQVGQRQGRPPRRRRLAQRLERRPQHRR